MSAPNDFRKRLNIVNCYECGKALKMTCLCAGCAKKQINAEKQAEKLKQKPRT